ncbi:hypothetical protein TNCV_681471 [Trichonephila clavipes]|nr:hypothetical protein TNCV_681471 [Trichonephila clavipes]
MYFQGEVHHNPFQEKFRALHTEEAFNGLFDFSIASKVTSGKILLQSQKQMKFTGCNIRIGGWCRRSQPRVAIWLCIAIANCALALSFNNITLDLRKPGLFLRITTFNFDQGVTIPCRHCDTLVPTTKSSLKSRRFFRMQSLEVYSRGL